MRRLKLRFGVCKALSYKMIEDRTWSRLPTMEMIALHIFVPCMCCRIGLLFRHIRSFYIEGCGAGKEKAMDLASNSIDRDKTE